MRNADFGDLTSVSDKSVPLTCPTRVSHKGVPPESASRLPHNNIPQECLTRTSNNVESFVFECVCAFRFVGSILSEGVGHS